MKLATIGSLLSLAAVVPSISTAQVRVIVDNALVSEHVGIQEAVDMAPADASVVVPSGVYEGDLFIHRPIVIKGREVERGVPILINGTVRVEGVNAEGHVALSSLSIETLEVAATTSTVVLDRLELFGESPCMHLNNCRDVRALYVESDVAPGFLAPGTWWIENSRLDATHCKVTTRRANFGLPGTPSVLVENSFLQMSHCMARGGPGGHESLHATHPLPPGDGAPAVLARAGSGTRISWSTLYYADGGHNAAGPAPGLPAASLRTIGGFHELMANGLVGPGGSHYVEHDASSIVDSTSPIPTLALGPYLDPFNPYLDVITDGCFGSRAQVRVSGQAWFAAVTGARIPDLCVGGVSTLLTPTYPGGTYSGRVTKPTSSSSVVFAQAVSLFPGSPRQNTNSIAFVH